MSENLAPFRIEDVQPIALPPNLSLERLPPESIQKAYSGRLWRFDYKTLFYDLFLHSDGKTVYLSGPPLANLKTYVEQANFLVDGVDVSSRVRLKDKKRRQASQIDDAPGQHLQFIAPHFSANISLTPADATTLAGKNVLLAYNRDNPLAWIRDWINYYVKAHGVNAVLFYDNGSIAYASQELLDEIRFLPGIEAVILVRWPFIHGPVNEQPGVGGDASYSQAAMLVHAREKFLSQARSVIACDVDELIYSYTGESLCDAVASSDGGYIKIGGTWIESVTNSTSTLHRHLDFRHIDPDVPAPKSKWAAAPTLMNREHDWGVHGLSSFNEDARFHFAHFRGISTSWKKDKVNRTQYSPPQERHQVYTDIEDYIAPYLEHASDKPRARRSASLTKSAGSVAGRTKGLEKLKRFAKKLLLK